MKSRLSGMPYGLLVAVGFGMVSLASMPRVAFAAGTEAPFLSLNQTAMDKMMAGMSVKPTGDADRDFVAMMVPHHQGAIDMATAELQYGHNQKLLRIAQEIVVEQEQEIAAMRLAIGEPASSTWVTTGNAQDAVTASADSSPANGDRAFIDQSNAAMDKMMADMAIKPTGDVDHDFVAMMVPHHQGAIDMAKVELQYGQSAQLKTIAQEIIVDQMQEITLMRLALGEPLPQSTASPTQTSSGTMSSTPADESDASQTQMRLSPAIQMSPVKPEGTH